MKKLFILLIFTAFFYAQEIAVKQDSVVLINQFNEMLHKYVADYKKIKNDKKNYKNDLKQGVYEKKQEYDKRVSEDLIIANLNFDRLLNELNDKLKKSYLVKIPVDSVHYYPDKEMALVHHPVVRIPNNNYKPYYNAYTYPMLYYPHKWYAKKGFGLALKEIYIQREIAKENDIVKNKGFIYLGVNLFIENNKPSMKLNNMFWTIDEVIIWKWEGKTELPKDIYKRPMKSVL